MRLIFRASKRHEHVHRHTERRVGLLLSRFAPRLVSVRVLVAERDGGLVWCSIHVRCSSSRELAAEVVDEDAHAAVERALARAARSLRRALAHS